MAAYAPVAPISILEQFAQQSILGQYHLLLAHDIVKDPLTSAAYHHVFGKRTWEGTVILDNSIIELGNAVDLDIISAAAETCRANVIVLPDVLEDGPATVESIASAWDEWEATFDAVLGSGKYRFMIVPQGKTFEEFDKCAEELAGMVNNDVMWGVPRNTVKLHGSRHGAIMSCHSIDDSWPIHMLGFSDNLQDDIECARMREVTGIDSAVPIRVPSFEAIVNGEVAPPRGDWWNQARYKPEMVDNLMYARQVFTGYQDLVNG